MSVTSIAVDDRGRLHKWSAPVSILHTGTHDGNDRTERTRGLCGMCKITVHPPSGFAWREWRTKDGMVATLSTTPPCMGEAQP